jgi:hypothetical protein
VFEWNRRLRDRFDSNRRLRGRFESNSRFGMGFDSNRWLWGRFESNRRSRDGFHSNPSEGDRFGLSRRMGDRVDHDRVTARRFHSNLSAARRFESNPWSRRPDVGSAAVEWKRGGDRRVDTKRGREDPPTPSFRVEPADSGGGGEAPPQTVYKYGRFYYNSHITIPAMRTDRFVSVV